MIRTLIFDFGNVIAFFDHQKAIDKLRPFTTLTSVEIRRRVYDGNLEDDYEAGRITTADFTRRVIELCELKVTPEQYLTAFVDIFEENHDVTTHIPKLAKRYRLLLASNTNDAHAVHFRKQFSHLLQHFHFQGTSFELGARKPTLPFYAKLHENAEANHSECLFIDDLPANVEAGIEFGWKGVIYPKKDFAQLLQPFGVEV